MLRHPLRPLPFLVAPAGPAQPLDVWNRLNAIAVLVHRHVAALAEHDLVGCLAVALAAHGTHGVILSMRPAGAYHKGALSRYGPAEDMITQFLVPMCHEESTKNIVLHNNHFKYQQLLQEAASDSPQWPSSNWVHKHLVLRLR